MATMTVWKFPTANGAEMAERTLTDLQRRGLIQLQDAAIVTYPEGAKKPKTRQLANMTGAGALGGAFWGMLFGLIFFIPLLGLAIGAGIGALTGSMTDVGIDDAFIKRMREEDPAGHLGSVRALLRRCPRQGEGRLRGPVDGAGGEQPQR